MPDDEGEVIVELSFNNLVTSLDHSIGNVLFETVVQVGLCSTLFEQAESFDDRNRHALAFTSNLKVLERSLGLGAPVAIGRYLNGAKRVSFFPELLSGGK